MTIKCDRCQGDRHILIFELGVGATQRECPKCKGNGWVEAND